VKLPDDKTDDVTAPSEKPVPTVIQIERGLVVAAVVIVAVLIAFVAAGGLYLRRVQEAPSTSAGSGSANRGRCGSTMPGSTGGCVSWRPSDRWSGSRS
jgi:beta-lactamase class C